MDQWLVRTSKNIIGGPFTRQQIIDKIKAGELGLQDEVCEANRYWFDLHEREEVKHQLGIEMPRSGPRKAGTTGADEDVTETQLESSAGQKSAAAPASSTTPVASSLSSQRRPGRVKREVPAPFAPGLGHAPQVSLLSPQMERPSVWRGFAWILIVAACLTVYAVLKLLRSA